MKSIKSRGALAARSISVLALLSLFAAPAFADTGDTAWMLTSTALVLFMTLPGLALFYGGLVQGKNVLSVLMQCLVLACLMSLVWVAVGYSIAFGDGNGAAEGAGALWGGLSNAFLGGLTTDAMSGTIPESVFVMFQMTFAIITPALIVGAYVERVNFGAVLIFSVLWLVLVYAPVCHWVWGGGWLGEMGVMDFAGGLVVHLTAGVAAIVAAVVLGNRKGFPKEPMPPHNMTMCITGAGMLWVGWFGFNGGSALAANGDASMAMLVTHISAATGAFTWMCLEWIKFGKPSALGAVTGMVAGLGTITPASGFVGPAGALIIGLAAGIVCFNATLFIKRTLKIDDSLDVFPVHGVGGMLGTLLTAVFASNTLGIFSGQGMDNSIGEQLWVQFVGVIAVLVFTVIATFIILKVVDLVTGLRCEEDEEQTGLDLIMHNEKGYDL